MKITCPNCEWSVEVPDEKVPNEGGKGNCPKCKSKIDVKKEIKPAHVQSIVPTNSEVVRNTNSTKSNEENQNGDPQRANHTTRIKCKHCALEVPIKAEICPYCRKRLKMSITTKAIITFCGIVFIIGTISQCFNTGTVTQTSSNFDNNAAEAIENYLAENFGMPSATTSWYNNIKSINVQGNTVHVKTDLLSDDTKVSNVCTSIYGWYVMEHRVSKYGWYVMEHRVSNLKKIRIYGTDGKQLNNNSIGNDKCLP